MKKIEILTVVLFLVLIGAGNSFSSNPKVEKSEKSKHNKKCYVVLMGGQSNMLGHGKLSELVGPVKYDNIKYINFGYSHSLRKAPKSFGPEKGLTKVLAEHYPKKDFIIYKYAIGGASMYDWAPDYDPEKAKITGNPQFGSVYKKFKSIFNDSIASKNNIEVVAFLWMQGESDSKYEQTSNEYFDNFKKLIERVRKDFDQPDLPVLFAKVNPQQPKFKYLEKVNAAQKQIAQEVPNAWLIETNGLSKGNDNVHYNTEGQLELGKRFGEQFVKVVHFGEKDK
ncbi:sialate O-acetylesterase [Maribellus mangrovi]|uniref:sialate O-acetylesterase n=1 Tax=Maribellus mangrovi TaxID=3133146 RepID=UPI0030ECC72F